MALNPKQPKIAKQRKSNRGGNPNWKPGVSGNPKGRSPDPAKKEVLAIFKEAAPELLRIAIKRAIGFTETIKQGKETKTIVHAGNNDLLKALVLKALPDDVNVNLNRSVKELTRDELIAIASRGRRGDTEEGLGEGQPDTLH